MPRTPATGSAPPGTTAGAPSSNRQPVIALVVEDEVEAAVFGGPARSTSQEGVARDELRSAVYDIVREVLKDMKVKESAS